MLIGTNYDFNRNQALNLVIHQATAPPSSPQEGMVYTNTTSHTLNAYLNGSWTALTTAGGTLTGGGSLNQLAIWTGASSVGGLTSANNAVLVTDGSGVPSLSTDIPTGVTIGGAYNYRAGGTDVAVGDGGTGLSSFTQYGLLYASATTTIGQITETTTNGKALVSTAAGAPVFGKVVLTQPATLATLTILNNKTLTVNNSITLAAGDDASTLTIPAGGGTLGTAAFTASTAYIASSLMTTIGDLIYGGAAGAATRLAGLAVNGTYILTETVVASTAVAPVWTNVNTLSVAKATNLVGAAWGVPYQSATDTTSFVAQPGVANRVFLSGANNAAPAWSASTLSLGGAFSTSSTFSVTGALSIGGAFTTSSAFTTTGAFTTSLTQGANLTLTLPPVATANMIYNTAAPGANNQLTYAATTTNAISYITAPAALSVLTQSSAGAAPAWTSATGTGSPVMGTDPTITINSSGKIILNFVPATGNDPVNKTYVDGLLQGVTQKPAARMVAVTALPANTYNNGASGVGATLTGTANGPLSAIDGVTPVVNDIIFVIGEATQANNGLYQLTQLGIGGSTPYILTRLITMDQAGEFVGSMVPVGNAGTNYKNSLWLCTTTGAVVVGTTAITFQQMNAPTDWTIGTGLSLSGQNISVNGFNGSNFTQYGLFYASSTSAFGQIALPGAANQVLVGATAGVPLWGTLVITPTGGSNATLAIAAGKTLSISNTLTLAGADGKTINFGSNSFTLVTSKDAVTYTISGTSSSSSTQILPTKFNTTITGAGPHTVTHNLGTKDVTVTVWDNSDNLVVCDVVTTSTTVVTLTWGFGAPGASTYRVVVTG